MRLLLPWLHLLSKGNHAHQSALLFKFLIDPFFHSISLGPMIVFIRSCSSLLFKYSKNPRRFPQGSEKVPHLTETSGLKYISKSFIFNNFTSISLLASIFVVPKRNGPLPSVGVPSATCNQHPGISSHSANSPMWYNVRFSI